MENKEKNFEQNNIETIKEEQIVEQENGKVGFWGKVTRVKDNVVTSVKTKRQEAAVKRKDNKYARDLKKYNPIFFEQYFSEKFSIPNMIIIVDDRIRENVEVCQGAIGWIEKTKEMDVFFLYDEMIDQSGIKFVPSAECDAVYFVDKFDRKRYVRVDDIFQMSFNEKLAELKKVAYCLGAKKCSIQMSENLKESKSTTSSLESESNINVENINVKSATSKSKSKEQETSNSIEGVYISYFAGSDNPVRPQLKWFQNDDNINNLIEMRCTEANPIEYEKLSIRGASSVTMSVKSAAAIDATLGYVVKGRKSLSKKMEKEAIKQENSELIFEVWFTD